MFVEKTFQEIIDFIKKFFVTIFLILARSKKAVYDLRGRFFLRLFLAPLIFLSITIIIYLFYSGSVSEARTSPNGFYPVDFLEALDVFKLKFETSSQFGTVIRSIPIIALYCLYVFLITRLLIKNKNEQSIIRNYMFYWCGVQIILYIILSFSYYFAWQVLKIRLTSVRLIYYTIYIISYAVPFLLAYVALRKLYNWGKQAKIIALLLSIAILFSIDVVYLSSSLINKIAQLNKTSPIIVKGALDSDSLIAEHVNDTIPSLDPRPLENLKFDLYIYNKSENLFLVPRNEILQLRYLKGDEYKTFQIDTILCPPTEAIRNEIFWYEFKIIAAEDSVNKEIRIAPGEVKWITVQMFKPKNEKKIFNLEHCYPYKVLRLYGFTPNSRSTNEKYRWERIEIDQFVVFQNRFKDEF